MKRILRSHRTVTERNERRALINNTFEIPQSSKKAIEIPNPKSTFWNPTKHTLRKVAQSQLVQACLFSSQGRAIATHASMLFFFVSDRSFTYARWYRVINYKQKTVRLHTQNSQNKHQTCFQFCRSNGNLWTVHGPTKTPVHLSLDISKLIIGSVSNPSRDRLPKGLATQACEHCHRWTTFSPSQVALHGSWF